MMRWQSGLAAALTSATMACAQSGLPDPEGAWVLHSIGGEIVEGRATVSLSEQGRIRGAGPCNGYSASNLSDLPVLTVGPIRSTRRACADLSLENRFLALLARMTKAWVTEDGNLVLSGPDGEMRFRPGP